MTSYGGPVFGGDLRWNPPVRGLTVGMSRLNEMITGKGSYDGKLGIPAQPHYQENSKHDWTNQYYGRFVKEKLHAESEYRRYCAIRLSSAASLGLKPTFAAGMWVEVIKSTGGRGRILLLALPDLSFRRRRGSPSYPDAQTHDFDKVVTASSPSINTSQ